MKHNNTGNTIIHCLILNVNTKIINYYFNTHKKNYEFIKLILPKTSSKTVVPWL